MSPSCDRCRCGGRGTCAMCRRITATVARESAPPAQRTDVRALGGAR